MMPWIFMEKYDAQAIPRTKVVFIACLIFAVSFLSSSKLLSLIFALSLFDLCAQFSSFYNLENDCF